MATIYTDQYQANLSNGTYVGKTAHGVAAKGVLMTTYATYTGTVASDTLKIMPLQLGSKIHRISIKASTDMDAANDFTFDLGNATTANAYLNDSTGLQSATGFEAAVIACIEAAVAGAADTDLQLVRVAGALEVSGTIRFAVEWYIP